MFLFITDFGRQGSAKVASFAHNRGSSEEPLYRQVRVRIVDGVASGAYAPGERLPSERALCEEFGVSRLTLRRALKGLVDEGLLHSAAGRGWFVAGGPVGEPANVLLSFTEMARERGLRPGSRVLSNEVRRATLDEADALSIAPASELLDLRRLRLLDDVPIAIAHSRVPLSVIPNGATIDFAGASLYAELTAQGVEPVRCTATIQAVPADGEQAGLLDVEIGAPLLRFSQVPVDRQGRPVEISVIVYRGDGYRFRANLVARH